VHASSEAERAFRGVTAAPIRASAAWKKLAAARPPHLGAMTEEARRKLREAMDIATPKRPRSAWALASFQEKLPSRVRDGPREVLNVPSFVRDVPFDV